MGRSVVQDFRSSLQFDGTGAQYVSVADANNLDLTTDFTIAGLVNITATGVTYELLEKGTLGGATTGSYKLAITPAGVLYCTIVNVVDVTDTGAGRILPNGWTHIAVTHTGTAYNFYINGRLNSTVTNANNPTANTDPLIIGRRSFSTATALKGKLAGIKIWNSNLTAQQIYDLYTSNVNPVQPSLQLMGDGSGITATDSSGNGNNGTITGATYSSDVPSKTRTTAQDIKASINQVANTDGIAFTNVSHAAGWTLAIWFKNTLSNQIGFFLGGGGATDNKIGFNATNALAGRIHSGGTFANWYTGAQTPALGVWHCLIVAKDNAGVVTTYLNGAAGVVQYGGVAQGNTTPWGYVGRTSSPTQSFRGNYSTLRIWDGVTFTQAQADAYYFNNTFSRTGLIREYLLGEGAGTTATDSSGNNNNGTITGATFSADTPTKVRQTVGANLVRNGNFEYAPPFTAATTGVTGRWIDGTSSGSLTNSLFGWAVFAGSLASYSFVNDVADTAHPRSFKISSGAILARAMNTHTSDVPTLDTFGIKVQPSTSYTMTGWIKTNLISGSGGGAYFGIRERNSTGVGGLLTTTAGITTTTGWTFYSISVTVGSTARYISTELFLDGSTGAVMDAWFDDITLRETVPVGRGATQDFKASLALTGTSVALASPPTLTTDVTYALLFKPTSTAANQNLLAIRRTLIRLSPTSTIAWFPDVDAPAISITTAGYMFGRWNHLAITQAGTSYVIYLNGTQIASGSGSALDTFNTTNQLGGYTSGTNYTGLMAKVRLFARALSSTEVVALYSGDTYDATGLIGRYDLGEGAGTTAFDTSGNNNHGTITSATYSADVPSKKRQVVGENMVRNGDMEYIPPFTAPTSIQTQWVSGDSSRVGGGFPGFGWAIPTAGVGVGGTVSFDTTVSKTGTASLKLDITNTTGAITAANFVTAGGLTREQARDSGMPIIQPNTSYTLTAWIKTLNVPASGAYLDLRQINSDGTTATTNSSTRLSGTNDWTFVTITVVTQPAARYACILPRNNISGNVCTAWFDDIVLTPTVQ